MMELCWSLFLTKLQAFRLFSCEYCQNFKDPYFEEHLQPWFFLKSIKILIIFPIDTQLESTITEHWPSCTLKPTDLKSDATNFK